MGLLGIPSRNVGKHHIFPCKVTIGKKHKAALQTIPRKCQFSLYQTKLTIKNLDVDVEYLKFYLKFVNIHPRKQKIKIPKHIYCCHLDKKDILDLVDGTKGLRKRIKKIYLYPKVVQKEIKWYC